MHFKPQVPDTQAAAPFTSPGQLMHMAPQAVASSSAAQRAPQRWYPEPQVKSQLVPSQVVALAPVGFEQDVHAVVPHESTLVFEAQTPLQSCVPFGHTPEQAADEATQAPAQGFIPEGQAGTQAVPLHVTLPPVGA